MRLGASGVAGLVALSVALAGCGQAAPGRPLAVGRPSALPVSRESRVVVIVMENKEAGEVIGQPDAPYATRLARRFGLATRDYAITHPSLPNYMALTSGSTAGIDSDCTTCRVHAANLADQLDAAGISWRAYLEGYPGHCFEGGQSKGYLAKHNPFIHYADVIGDRGRCSHLVSFGALASDLRRGRLPRFSWITPNRCDDTHDCGVSIGDTFLAATVPALLREIGPAGFVVITWDEGTSDAGCCGGDAAGGRVATIVAGPLVRRGARELRPLDHYGVLATIERAFGLAPLAGASRGRSGSLDALFRRPPRLR